MHSHSLSVPSSGSGERIRGAKVGKLMDWYQGSSTDKVKAAKFTTSLGQAGVQHPRDTRASSPGAVAWEDKCLKTEPSLPPPPLSLCADIPWIWSIPVVTWGQLSLTASPSQLLVQARWGGVRSRKAPDSVWSLPYQHCLQHKPKTQPLLLLQIYLSLIMVLSAQPFPFLSCLF